MGQWKGRGAKKYHPAARGAHQGQAGARDPRERFAGIAAEQQQRRGGRKTPAPSQRGRGTQQLTTSPSPKLLTVFCSFLDPSFILRCVRSQSHQVKPGRSSRVSPNLSQHPERGEAGAGCALPFPGPNRAVDFVSPSLSLPKRVPPSPVPQSTDQEGMTIFMLRVTGIRGLWRNILGGLAQV